MARVRLHRPPRHKPAHWFATDFQNMSRWRYRRMREPRCSRRTHCHRRRARCRKRARRRSPRLACPGTLLGRHTWQVTRIRQGIESPPTTTARAASGLSVGPVEPGGGHPRRGWHPPHVCSPNARRAAGARNDALSNPRFGTAASDSRAVARHSTAAIRQRVGGAKARDRSRATLPTVEQRIGVPALPQSRMMC
jgi:hypothetical protein